MPTRRAFLAAMIPAVAVFGMFWRWLDFEELEAWRRVAPDLADPDSLPSDAAAPAHDDPLTQAGRSR